MRRLAIFGCALTAFGLGSPALAQETQAYDRIDLMANASVEIANDLLVAIVFAEVENNDQANAADQVNSAISWAADRARRVDGIDIETTSYSTRPLYANGRRITGWVARQGLRLESRDAEALSELVGRLQERVAVQSIDYAVSPEAQDRAEQSLIAEALRQFNQRANLIANELGRDGFRIVRLNVGTGGNMPFPQGRNIAFATAEVSAPTIEAGSQTMTVTVSGEIELTP